MSDRYHFVGLAILFIVGIVLLVVGISLDVNETVDHGWIYGLIVAGGVLMALAIIWLLIRLDGYQPALKCLFHKAGLNPETKCPPEYARSADQMGSPAMSRYGSNFGRA